MEYQFVREACFLERLNRFTARVVFEGEEKLVHVKNTGRCRELLLPRARVILAKAQNPNRKTDYDLVGVYKPGLGLVNMDSQAPNQVVKEWLYSDGARPWFPELTFLKPEYSYGASRMDFYLEYQEATGETRRALMEVKGVTLERVGIGYFPDAPTQRGVRHIEELCHAAEQGMKAFLVFVIQMPGIRMVCPNNETHPAFGEAWERARRLGVTVLFLSCAITEQKLVAEGCFDEKKP